MYTTDSRSLSELLPHRTMLTETTMLLTRPLYPGHVTWRPYLGLGAAFSVEQLCVEMRPDSDVLKAANGWGLGLSLLGEGVDVQVIQTLHPADSVPEWDALRQGAPPQYDIPLKWQRQMIESGGRYGAARLMGRLRRITTTITVRMPVRVNGHRTLIESLRDAFTLHRRETELQTLEAELAESVKAFEHRCDRWFVHLAEAGFGPARLGAASLLCRIASGMGRMCPQRRYDPDTPMALQVADSSLIYSPGSVQFRDQHAHVMSVHDLPAETWPGMLTGLRTPETVMPVALWQDLDRESATVAVNIHIPSAKSVSAWLFRKKVAAKVETLQKESDGSTSQETQCITDDIAILEDQIQGEPQIPVYLSTHIVIWGDSPQDAADKADLYRNRVARLGGTLRLIDEPRLTPTLFLQTLPLGFDHEFPAATKHLLRSRLVSSATAADMAPVYGGFRGTGTPAVLFQSRRGEPVFVDHFDIREGLHALVTGTTGAGKSFLIAHMVAQLLPLGASIVILDRLASYRELTEGFGGLHLELDFNHPILINPFSGPLDGEHKARATGLITVLAGGEQPLGPVQQGVISEAIGMLFDQAWTTREPTLSDLVTILRGGHTDWAEHGGDIALMLAPFHGRGRFAGFLDGQNEFELNPSLTVFELSALTDSPQLQTAIGLSLMSILAAYFSDPIRLHQPKYLFNDEVWALLEHPSTAQVLIEIARTFRKRRTSAAFISQNPRDFLTPVGRAIGALCSIRYLLTMDHTIVDDMAEPYALEPQEVRSLKTLQKGDGYSEAYLRLPQQRGGVIRIIADHYTRWAAEQQDPQVKYQLQQIMNQ